MQGNRSRAPSVCFAVESSFVAAGSFLDRAKSLGVRWCTAERAALAGMLIVVVPITARLFPALAHVVVPSTLLVTVGYWLWLKSIRSDALLVLHAIWIGALAGYMNTIGSLHLHLWLSGKFEELPTAGPATLLLGFVGCLHGVSYGLVLLPPVWMARRSRRFHSAEAFDRVLASTGLWGLITLACLDPIVDDLAMDHALGGMSSYSILPTVPVSELGILAVAGCLLMLVFGMQRLRQRRAWLARVRRGNVPGWLVVSSEQFSEDLDELPVFCPRLFGRAVTSGELVLAEGASSRGAYRSEGLTPRFRIVSQKRPTTPASPKPT